MTHSSHDNYALWETPLPTPREFEQLSQSLQCRALIQAGHLAPSTHNAQPWAFSYIESEPHITVYLDRRYVLPASDKDGRQSLISVGCAIENICVALEAYDREAQVTIQTLDPEDMKPCPGCTHDHRYVPIASVTFSVLKNTGPRSSELLQAISERRVMRTEFDPSVPVPPDLAAACESIATERNTEFRGVTNPMIKMGLAEFQAQADGYVIHSKKFSSELGNWLLPNDTGEYRGMPGATFGLTREEAVRIHEGLTGASSLRPEDGLKFALGGKAGIEKSPLLGIITATKDEPLYWIQTGRTLERIFLTMTAGGFSLAVHAGIVEVPLVNRLFSLSLKTTRRVMSVFRIGKPLRITLNDRPHSPRTPLEDVIIKKD